MMDLSQLLKDFGPMLGLLIFFIWRDWRRQDDLIERVRNVEDANVEIMREHNQILATVVTEASAVIAANTEQWRTVGNLMLDCKARKDG